MDGGKVAEDRFSVNHRLDLALGRLNTGDREGGAALLQSALGDEPENAVALDLMARLLMDERRFATAEICWRKALVTATHDAGMLDRLARCLMLQEKNEAAVAYARRAVELSPDDGAMWHVLGLALCNVRSDEALIALGKAKEKLPAKPEIIWDLALAELLRGNYAAGWQGHDARFDWRHPFVRKLPFPLWDGKASGERIWLYAEQGLGDVLMVWRYVDLLKQFFDEVIIDVQGELVEFLSTQALSEGITVRNRGGDPIPAADYQLPLTSLLDRFDVRPETLDGGAYLTPPMAGRHYKGMSGARLSVGLCWAGGAANPRDGQRSMTLQTLLPVCEIPDVDFYSFQVGPRVLDLPTNGGNLFMRDIGSLCSNFNDTAHYLSKLDLLVTVDTSIAHLAGALGVPTIIMLSHSLDWRWGWPMGWNDTHTPWYSSARLVRQETPGDWAPVIARVRTLILDAKQRR